MIKKIRNFKFVIQNRQAGMSYIELIVVLSIFAVISTAVMFDYGSFQSKVDIRSLGSDIALQIVQAQKSSLSGILPPTGHSYAAGWKPSYGVYFSTVSSQGADSTHFIYFVDTDNSKTFIDSNCTGECISQYSITKNNKISNLSVFYQDGTSDTTSMTNLTITFTRPDSGATLKSNITFPKIVSYVQITVVNAKGQNPIHIRLYPPGRVQIN